MVFSAANLALAGFPQTNALGENLPSRYLNMFNLRLCNAATIRYSILKSGHMHFCGKGYNYNMTVWILARNDINFSMAAGLIRLHMPGVK